MGKLKKGRKSRRRVKSVARKQDASAKDDTTRQNKIVPLITQLTSSAPNDRSVALNAITVLADDSHMRRLLLKERLVATIMEHTLNDTNDELVVESFGLLRNLAIDEGYEVAKHLWRSNIWAAIEAALAKVLSTLQYLAADKKLDQKRLYMFYDFVDNIFSLVLLISCCSTDLYESVYSKIDPVVTLAVDILAWNCQKLRSIKLFNAALAFLYDFASDSANFVSRLSLMRNFSLSAVADAVSLPAHKKNTLGRVYVEGLRFHFMEVTGDCGASKNDACARAVQSLLELVAHVDLDDVCAKLTAADNAAALIQKPDAEKGTENGPEKPQDIDVPFGGQSADKTHAKADLQSIEITLDLLTSVCELLAVNDANPLQPVVLDDNVTAVMLNTAFSSCMHLLRFDREHGHALQLSPKVLAAFNNMLWLFLSAAAIPVDWYAHIPDLWLEVEQAAHSDDLDTQKTLLSIMWAMTKAVGPEVRDKISLDNVNSLLRKCTDITSSAAAADDCHVAFEYLLSAVGFLGAVAQVIDNTDVTTEISEFLLTLTAHFADDNNNKKDHKALEIPVECLNLLYDIFGDAAYAYDEPVFVGGNYLQRLQQLEPSVRAFYKKIDRNRNAGLKLRVEEAWGNLGRFIEYKRAERR